MKRRILSIITALALCLSLFPTWAFAAEGEPDTGLCGHHPVHTEDCGCIAPTEGQPCGHQHTAECYTLGVLPDGDSGEPDESGADTENPLDCQHIHDSECGYVQASPGTPCGYVCKLCPLEDLISALPDDVTPDNAEVVRAQLDEILDQFKTLPEEDQSQIDLSRCYELQDALALCQGEQPGTEMTVEEQEDKSGGLIFEYASNIPKMETVYTAGSGTITWTPQLDAGQVVSGTLTLSSAAITASGKNGIKIPVSATIVLEGENQINVTAYEGVGIRVEDIYSTLDETLTIQGSGSLTINSTGHGIFTQGDVIIANDADVEINVSTQLGCIYTNFGDISIKGSTVKAKTLGDISNNSAPLTANKGNITIENSHVAAISPNGAAMKAGQSILFTDSDVVIIGKSAADDQGAYQGTLIFDQYNGGKINISGGTLYAENKYDNTESSNYGHDIPFLRSYITATDSAVIYYKHGYRQLVQNGNNIQYASCTYDEAEDKITAVGNAYVIGTVEWNENIIFGTTTAIYNYNQILGTGNVAGNIIIPSGVTVTIPNGSGIYNYGTITNNGTIVVENEFQNIVDNSKVNSTGTIINNGTIDVKVSGDMRSTGTVTNNETLNIEGIYYNYPTGKIEEGTINGVVLEYNPSVSPKQFYFVAHGDAKLYENDLKFMGNTNNTMLLGIDASTSKKQTMTVPADATLTIQKNCTLDASQPTLNVTWDTLSEFLSVAGNIVVDGTLKLPAAPDQTKLAELLSHITGTGQVLIGDSAVYPITVTGGTADKRFAAQGEEVTLTPKPENTSQQFKEWEVSPSSVSISENKFTMPGQAVVVTGKYVTLLTDAKVQVTGTYTYNGSVQNPAVEVTLGGKELTLGTDYTVTCSSVNAGTGTVTITGTGNYTGEITAEFDIGKAAVTVTALTGSTSKTYDGKTDCDGTGLSLTLSGVAGSDDGKVSVKAGKFVYDTAGAGTGKTVTASDFTLEGDAAGNYSVADDSSVSAAVGTITKAAVDSSLIVPQNLNVANSLASTYTFLLSNLRPSISGDWGTVEYAISVSFTETGYYNNDAEIIAGPSGALNTLSLPILSNEVETTEQVGTVTVTVKSANYEDFTNEIHIMAQNKKKVTFGGVEGVTAVYNGQQVAGYTGTLTMTDSDGNPVELTPEIRYTGRLTTSWDHADTPPKDAGTYSVVFRVPDDNPTYIGRENLAFEITPARITIKADDKRADVGSTKPTLTYTVTGLAAGDTLSAVPTLTCGADMNTAGSYPITASGAAVPTGGNYNEEIIYLPGTLTVELPVTGVRLDRTTVTLQPGEECQLTATVEPSNATQNKDVTWSSSNSAVAEVDSNGNVIAHAPGTAVITVSTVSGGHTAACNVTVEGQTYTVSFQSGGGAGTPITMDNISEGTAIRLPENPFRREGYTFTGWGYDGDVYEAGAVFTMPDCSVTFTAQWKMAVYSINGIVLQRDESVPSVTVRLMQGTMEIARYVTGPDGRFVFENLPSGVYDLIAEKDGVIVTVRQEITTSSETLTITLPAGKTNSVVEIKGDTPPMVVEGLENLFQDDRLYTAEDEKIITAGGTVEFKMTAEKQDTSAAGSLIEAVKSPGQTLGLFLNLSITKTVIFVDGTKSTNPVFETGSLIGVRISLPSELQGKSSYAVYRIHNGAAEALPSGGSGEHFEVNVGKTVITIFAQRFSTYAIAWSSGSSTGSTPVNPQRPSRPSGSGGGSVNSYAVTVTRAEHGKVTSNRTNASGGSTVTLTVTPDTGYVLDVLTVTDSQGNEIKLTSQGSGKYIFTMPSRAVTVKTAFVPLPEDVEQPCGGCAACPSRGFTDLGAVGIWYHEAVDYVLRNGLMNGYSGTLFGPDDNLSRAQFAQIFYNRAGRPAVTGGSAFADVPDGKWYTPAITWVEANGIAGGYGNGLFGPDDNITREQLATMLWRYAGSPAATDKELHFTDADKAGGYALDALRWAAENGILNGYGDGRLDPGGLATRAQAAQMLKNFIENQEENN